MEQRAGRGDTLAQEERLTESSARQERLDEPLAQAAGDGEALEQALQRMEAKADQNLRAAGQVVSGLRRVRGAARQGRLRELRAAVEAARRSVQTLDQEIANLAESWEFDEEAHLQSGAFAAELIAEGARQHLRISQLDDRLYAYPALIRVQPRDRAVRIDKALERRLRPSVLVGILRDAQRRPPRFKPADFLQSLQAAYSLALRARDGRETGRGVVPLADIYELLTLLPGQSREYSRQEFTRDVYLLDQSGETTTRQGDRLEFHASTGTRLARGTLAIVTQGGAEKRYWGVSFSRATGD